MPDHIQIGDVTPRIQYAGNGLQTQFTYPFPIFQDANIEAYIDGALKTLSVDYTVSGAGSSGGGAVTFAAAAANGAMVILRRRLAIKRLSDFQENGEFRAKVINDELDTLTACIQQVSDDTSRSLHLAAADESSNMVIPTMTERASKFLAFDANGDPVAGNPAPVGPQGLQGPAGQNGATILNGSGPPDNALGADGDFYFDTTFDAYYGPKATGLWPTPGTSLIGPSGAGNGDMLKANNLFDLVSIPAARANLGLGTAALANTGTLASNVPTTADADGRYLKSTSNLADLANAATARTNLGLGAAAVLNAAASGTLGLLRADGDASQLTNLPSGGGKLIAVHRTTQTADAALATCASGGTQVGSNLTVNIPTAGLLRLTMVEGKVADAGSGAGTNGGGALGLMVNAVAYFRLRFSSISGISAYNPFVFFTTTNVGEVSGGIGAGQDYDANAMTLTLDIATLVALGMPTGSQTVKVLMGDMPYSTGMTRESQIKGATKTGVFVLEVIDGS